MIQGGLNPMMMGGGGLELATITHVGTTYGGNDVTTFSLAAPTGILAGDIIFAHSLSSLNLMGHPSGFTVVRSDEPAIGYRNRLSYKIADGTESGVTYSFTQPSTRDCSVIISVFRNVSTNSGFIENSKFNANPDSGGTLIISDLTISSEKRALLFFGTNYSCSSSSGVDGSYSILLNGAFSGDRIGALVSLRNKTSSITSETITNTYSYGNTQSGILLSLVPKSI